MTNLMLLNFYWLDTPAEWILLVFDILFVIFVAMNIVDINRYEVRKVKLSSKKLKKGEKVRFVFIADLHSHKFSGDNEGLLRSIEKQQPDFIIIGGDMMTARPGKNNRVAISFLRRLLEKNVVYYGLGNHEHRSRLYPETYGKMYEEYFDAIASDNLKLLDNTTIVEPKSGIEISGLTIDRYYYKRFKRIKMDPAYVGETVAPAENSSGNPYKILIAHNPEYGDAYLESDYDLFLSGHLHGGIIRLPGIGGVASPAFHLFPKYNGGLYKNKAGDKAGYVSCGLGTHTVPMRFLNPGEVTVIEVSGE